MRLSSSARMHVVFQEEKETRIKELIVKDLADRRASGEITLGTTYSLVARSSDSPAARALFSVAVDAAEMGIELRTLFVQHATAAAKSIASGQVAATGQWRAISDARYLDAHEQLVLGDTKVWVGDCMRRDPSRRDTFETYSYGSNASVLWAARSFEHMWAAAAPVGHEGASQIAPSAPVIDASLIPMSDSMPNAAALRH